VQRRQERSPRRSPHRQAQHFCERQAVFRTFANNEGSGPIQIAQPDCAALDDAQRKLGFEYVGFPAPIIGQPDALDARHFAADVLDARDKARQRPCIPVGEGEEAQRGRVGRRKAPLAQIRLSRRPSGRNSLRPNF
jgi:hypothetical protein